MITDFGLAKNVGALDGENAPTLDRANPLTLSGAIVGTPSYMAPEQASAQKVLTTAVDVYSLGAILYEMLTSQPPFHADSMLDTIMQVLEREPTPPRALNPHVSRDLETICLKCLNKEPQKRYGSAEALAEDLERWLNNEPIVARRTGTVERAVKWARRRPAVASLLGAILGITCFLGGGVVWKWRDAVAAEQVAKAREKDAHDAEGKALALAEAEKQAAEAAKQERAKAEKARQEEADARKKEEEAKKKAQQERDQKVQALARADSLRISAEAAAARALDPGLSLLLAVEGVQRVPNHLTYHTLYNALEECREERTLPDPSGAAVRFVRYGPGARFYVTLSNTSGKEKAGCVWDAATHKLLAEWRGYGLDVGAADLSPDGKRMAVALVGYRGVTYHDGKMPGKHYFTDEVVYLWDTATGKEPLHLKGHTARVVSVRFSPDCKRLVSTSCDNTARLWDAATGKLLHVLKGNEFAVKSAAFSPDGRQILTLSSGRMEGGFDTLLAMLGALGGQKPAKEENPKQVKKNPNEETDPGPQTRDGDFSESGSSSVSATPIFGELVQARLWDVETGKELVGFAKKRPQLLKFGHKWFPSCAAISPDGKQVAIGFTEDAAAIWDAAKGKYEMVPLKGHKGEVHAVAFSPDGKKVVTADADRTVRIWDSATGKELLRLRGHQEAVTAVVFKSDGKELLSLSNDKTARLWDVETGEEKAVLKGHTGGLVSADFHPDGRHVLTAGDSTLRLWDVGPRDLATVLGGHKGAVVALAYSPDGRKLLTAAPDDEFVHLWDVKTGKELLVIGKDKHLGKIVAAHFSADGKRVVTASENTNVETGGLVVNPSSVHVWDAETGKDLLALKDHETGARAVALSADGKRLLTVSDGAIRTKTNLGVKWSGNLSGTKWANLVRLWDAANGKLLATLPNRCKENFRPFFSLDGRRFVVVVQQDPAFYLFDAETGKQLRALRKHKNDWGPVFAAFSPDGTRVATATTDYNERMACLWDATTGWLLATFQGFDNPLGALVFSADGKQLLTLAGRSAYVWDTTTRELRTVLKGHEEQIATAAFSPDGKQVVTAANDKTAVVWDAATGKMLALFRHGAAPTQVAYSPDGKQVATSSPDGTARLWPVDLLPVVLKRKPRGLTDAERGRYEVPADPAQAAASAAGKKADILWGGRWWAGVVREEKDGKYHVHYDGWDDSWNEWATKDRVRFTGGSAAQPGAAAAPLPTAVPPPE